MLSNSSSTVRLRLGHAILITLGGAIAIGTLGWIVSTDRTTAGGSHGDLPRRRCGNLEHSVTQVIEQQLTGIDHLMYFLTSSARQRDDHAHVRPGTNADIAQVQTQNKVSLANPRCRPRSRNRA